MLHENNSPIGRREPERERSPRSLRMQAVYREGCFHPIESVDIPENTRVHLQVKIGEDI